MNDYYDILDFKATIKHSYYGCDNKEAHFCETTDRYFPDWKAGALSWLSRYILPVIENASPRTLLAAQDMGRAYRTAIFPEYKSSRSKKEKSPVEQEQLRKLETWAKQLLSAIGATQIGVDGVEADDVIAWLCQNISYPKSVYTVDMDLLQLVDDKTILYLKNEPYTVDDLDNKGVPFSLTSICKSMVGDKSDSYGGVPGFGPVKFAHLLKEYGEDGVKELQDIVEHGKQSELQEVIDETGDKVLQLLMDNFSTWRTMWRLAKLHPELCWRPRAKKLIKPIFHKRVPSADKCIGLLQMVGGTDLWEDYFSQVCPSPLAVTKDNWEQLKERIAEEIECGDIMAFDWETSDVNNIQEFKTAAANPDFVDVLSHQLTGGSFCFGKHNENVIYIPVDHKDSPNLPKEALAEVLEMAGKAGVTKVAQNAKFEGVLAQKDLNLELLGVQDTRVMQRYVDENADAGLKAMSSAYLGYEQATYKETLEAAGASSMREMTLDQVFQYGIDDSLVTASLYDLLKLKLQLDGQWQFYQEWAVDPTVVLQHSYLKGVNINWKLQKELHQRDERIVEEKTEELRKLLEENVTGEVTEGAKSVIEAEKDYVFRKAKAKAEGDSDYAKIELAKWCRKIEETCSYVPYRIEVVMPRFSPTPKQLTAAAEKLGLPPIEKTTGAAITSYLQLSLIHI